MKKLILSLVLIFFISLSFVRIYSYSEDLNTPQITSEKTHLLISQKLETDEGKELVPRGAILGENDTEEVVFTYIIFVQEGIEIDYYINNIEINEEIVSNDFIGLFDFEFEIDSLGSDTIQIDLFGEKQEGYYLEITLILSMNFPTYEQYFQIAGQQLSFEITFESVETLSANTM